MKKYVILTVVLSAALLIFGLVAVNVPSAHAITTTLPDTGIVGDNFCSDPFFDNAPVSGNINTGSYFSSWFFNGGSYQYSLDNGLHFVGNDAWTGINYLFSSIPLNTDFTLSFYVKNTANISCGIRGRVNGVTDIISARNFSTSNSYRLITFTFNIPSSPSYDRYYLYFWLQTAATFDLAAVKFELGSSFTGFVLKDYQNYGYDQGFVEGSQVYSSRSYSLTYSDVEPGAVPGPGSIRYTKGYTDLFHITSSAALLNCSFSLIPSWFTYKNYEIISSGFIFLSDSNDNVTGVLIYASPQASVTPSSSDVQIISYLMVFEDYSSFVTIDPSLPSTVNPVLYPQIYSCSVNCQFGYSEFIDQMQSSYYSQGFTAGNASGYSDGFTVGRAEGYSAGLATAQNGNWFSLMSALVDIPIRSVTSLLSFDFLGFNMLNLLKLCITLFLFTFVLKILIGKLGS